MIVLVHRIFTERCWIARVNHNILPEACSRLKIRAFVLSWEAGEAANTAWAVRFPNRFVSTKAGCEMILFDEDRLSDSPFVERVWRCLSQGAAPFLSIAASFCELVVSRLQGKVTMTVRGPETRATPLGDCPGDGEWLGILLKLGTFLPHLPTRTLVDAEVNLPAVSRNSFWLSGSAWQLPDYDNADTFVDWLARKGLLAREPVVDAALQSHLKGRSLSTIQRRFLRAIGLTQSAVRQIERARSATHLLQQGVSILDTVLEAGYFDQPHLTRSLKFLIGQTPAQIREKSRPEQMPFLYKTTPFG